jgi:hypothetical protein
MREQQRLNPPPLSEKMRQMRIERQAKIHSSPSAKFTPA